MMRRTLLSLCVLPLFASLALAAEPPATDAIGAAVKQHLGPDFSGVVLVRSTAAAAPSIRTFGMANRDSKLPVQAQTPFQIGSISKWLSAVAVLRLVDQGKLALDVPVKTYVPELPPQAGLITLRQLLSNSAGLPNGLKQAFNQDKTVADLPLSHLDAARRFADGAPLFAPGSGWEYSPTTWIVVAAVVERVSGKAFSVALAELVLGPAGVKGTAVPTTPFKDLAGAAIAYRSATSDELNMSPHVVYVAASGTVHSTAADLASLAHAVYETPLLSASARAELSRVMVPTENYALGGRVLVKQLGGRARTVAWETGSTGGYKSLLAYVPGEGKTVVILNNTSMAQSALAAAGESLLQGLYP